MALPSIPPPPYSLGDPKVNKELQDILTNNVSIDVKCQVQAAMVNEPGFKQGFMKAIMISFSTHTPLSVRLKLEELDSREFENKDKNLFPVKKLHPTLVRYQAVKIQVFFFFFG